MNLLQLSYMFGTLTWLRFGAETLSVYSNALVLEAVPSTVVEARYAEYHSCQTLRTQVFAFKNWVGPSDGSLFRIPQNKMSYLLADCPLHSWHERAVPVARQGYVYLVKERRDPRCRTKNSNLFLRTVSIPRLGIANSGRRQRGNQLALSIIKHGVLDLVYGLLATQGMGRL